MVTNSVGQTKSLLITSLPFVPIQEASGVTINLNMFTDNQYFPIKDSCIVSTTLNAALCVHISRRNP